MAAMRTGQAQLLADGVPIPNEIIALGDRFTSSGAPTLRCRGPVVATTHQVSNWNSKWVPAMTSAGPLAGAVALARRGELFSVMAGRVAAAGAVALIVVDASRTRKSFSSTASPIPMLMVSQSVASSRGLLTAGEVTLTMLSEGQLEAVRDALWCTDGGDGHVTITLN